MLEHKLIGVVQYKTFYMPHPHVGVSNKQTITPEHMSTMSMK